MKYEEVYLKAYASVLDAQRGLEDYFRFYNGLRPHQALGYRTPAEAFHGEQGAVEGDSKERRGSPGQGIESLAGESGFSLNSPLILSKDGVHLTSPMLTAHNFVKRFGVIGRIKPLNVCHDGVDVT